MLETPVSGMDTRVRVLYTQEYDQRLPPPLPIRNTLVGWTPQPARLESVLDTPASGMDTRVYVLGHSFDTYWPASVMTVVMWRKLK